MTFLCSSYAPSDLFVLLSWSCGLYTVCLKHNAQFTSSDPWKVLVGSMATLLDMIAESTIAKPALKKGALVRTRRALRSVWRNSASFYSGYSFFTQAGDKILELISTLLSITKSTQTPLRMVSLLDVAISVLIRLKNVSDEPSHRLSQDFKVGIFHALLINFPSSVCQNSILGLYSSTILTTKTSLPEHTLVSRKPMTRYLNI